MVRKKLAMAILALSALQANFANALGLGNLSIKSALNQPLNAEIKLLDTGDLDPTQVKIQLATQDDFQRSGVDRDYFLTNLRFTVDMDGRGGGTIRITTSEPVVEPYLNFVIEARWPNGRLLREFAVLLDPPTFSANKGAAAVAPAATAGAQPARKATLQPPTVAAETQTTKTVPDADMSLPAAGKTGEYRVQVYDTLSKIAARYKPASDVSVAQTMLAIQRANPEAFINNNINLIKSGAVVRLPTVDDARAVTAEQAAQNAEEQTEAWRSGSGRSAGAASTAVAGPQLDASAPEPTKAEGGYREKARLSIAAPGASEKSSPGEGSGASGNGVAALRNQLTTSQEALEKGKRDNRELQSRLDDMERQIATLQRLISLKDDQLAALQTKPAGEKAAAAPAPAPTEPAAATQPSATPAPAAEAPPPIAAPPVPVPAPAPAKPVVMPKPVAQPSLLDQFTSNPLYLAGAGAALLALIGGFIWKRRKDAEEEESNDFTFDENDSFQFGGATADDTLINDDLPVADEGPGSPPAQFAEEPKKTVRPETGDAIAESDIYIAYGRYQQAVDLLSNAIDAEPARSDLRVKLLEVYVEMRNKEAFRQQFVALQRLGDSNAIAQVKDMLSSVDGVSDWLDDLPGSSSFGSGALAAGATAAATAAFVASASAPASASIEEPAPDLADELDAELELDLDLDLDGELEPASADELASELGDEFDLPEETTADGIVEFNLDLDADTTAASSQELSDLSLEFDTPAPAPAAAPNFDFGSTSTKGDEGLELDLGDDDLDEMLGELGDSGALSDLEDFSAETASVAQSQSVQEPSDLDLSEEFDLGSASEDLASPDLEIDVFAGLDNAQPETDFSGLADTPAAVHEPVTEPVFESAAVPAQTLDSGDDFDFLSDSDEVATKLDLARAYIDMGDTDGARDILDEVLQEGTDTQKEEASSLLSRIG